MSVKHGRQCRIGRQCFYRHTTRDDTNGNRLYAYLQARRPTIHSPPPSYTSRRSSFDGWKGSQQSSSAESLAFPLTRPPIDRGAPGAVAASVKLSTHVKLEAPVRDEARALARLLDQSNVMARLSLALEALEDCYGSPAFRFARDYQSSFWHQLVLSSVNKTFYHAFHPHVWNFCTIRTRDDLAAFQLHSRKAISYISIVDVSLSHIHPFLRDHRRTLSSIDIFFPPVYTSQSRQKVMSTLAELPLLKHLRLRDVGRPLSIEAICPILLEAPQLISLDIEQVILPGPNWGLAGVASLRCNLETIILRASIAPSSGTGGAALQRLLTPVASTLMHFAIHQPTHDILVEEGDEEEAQ